MRRGPGKGWEGGNKKHLTYNFMEGLPYSFCYLSKQNRIKLFSSSNKNNKKIQRKSHINDLLSQIVMLPSISIVILNCDFSSELIMWQQYTLQSYKVWNRCPFHHRCRELDSILIALTAEGFSSGPTPP